MMPRARANFFDASALVKVYSREPGSKLVRDYFMSRAPARFTTPFCFYETLNILKSKWKYQGKMSEAQYQKSASELVIWYSRSRITRNIEDVDITDLKTLREVQTIAGKHSLDFSDALQIVSVKFGPFSRFVDESQTLLVTADRGLAMAARAEGLRAWDVLTEVEP